MRDMTARNSWREWQWGLPGASLGISAGRRPPVAAGAKGEFEPFKNTTEFDGTVYDREWLG
jgi:hypothetical protein